jgi:RIO kinase 1
MSEVDRLRPEDEFVPTFSGSYHEREWIKESLGEFREEQWLLDVLYRVKGGKEATVYCCAAGPATGMQYIAAKVFRPRMFRPMRNDWLYKQGRTPLDADGRSVLDTRALRAIHRKTRFGRRLDTASWCAHEYDALCDLYDAGADVPRPLARGPQAILMQYLGDATRGAPVLHSVSLERAEARRLFDRLLDDVRLALRRFRIHADLSAHNVLYWEGDVWIIDWPQAVDATRHPEAFALLARDIERLCRYFARQGVDADPGRITADLWERFLSHHF